MEEEEEKVDEIILQAKVQPSARAAEDTRRTAAVIESFAIALTLPGFSRSSGTNVHS